LEQGDLGGALASIARALEIAEQRRDGPRRATVLKLRGMLERRAGNARVALQTLRSALTWVSAGEDALLCAEVLYEYGATLASLGDRSMAQDVLSTALRAFERVGARDWVNRVSDRLNSEELPQIP